MKKILLITLFFNSILNASSISTDKENYSTSDTITISFKDMEGLNQDWVGIYPVGTNNDWDNVVDMLFTGDKRNGEIKFYQLPIGNYEARAFYNNSFKLEAKHAFKVDKEGEKVKTSISTDKRVYQEGETIIVNFNGMKGSSQDWIGIYPVDYRDFKNPINWHWTKAKRKGTVSFKNLKVGNYQAIAFFENSYKYETLTSFEVKNNDKLHKDLLTKAKQLCPDKKSQTFPCKEGNVFITLHNNNNNVEHNGFYQVNLPNKSVKTLFEQSVKPWEYGEAITQTLFKDFKDTNFFVMRTNSYQQVDDQGGYDFYHLGKRFLVKRWYEWTLYMPKESLKIYKNNTKLYFELHDLNGAIRGGTITKYYYDISNLDNVKLVLKKEVPCNYSREKHSCTEEK